MDENYTFPKWLLEIDPQIENKINTVLKNNYLSEEDLRELLGNKLKESFFSKKNINIAQKDISFISTYAFKVEQKRHYENRKIENNVVPFDKSKFGNVGFEPDLEGIWDQYLIDKFAKKELKWVRGGSAKLLPCKQCNYIGQISCSNCKGNGEHLDRCPNCAGSGTIKEKCPNCRGTGKIIKGSVSIGGGKRVGTAVGYSSKDEQCIRCNASGYLTERCSRCSSQGQILVKCKRCKETGKITCPTCLGFRELYSAQTIIAKCTPLNDEFIISKFDKVKSSWFRSKGEYFEIPDSINTENFGKPIPEEGRVLAEGYTISIIPVTKAVLKENNKENSIYIYGDERNVQGVVSKYLDYKKIFLFIGLPLILLIIFLVLYFK